MPEARGAVTVAVPVDEAFEWWQDGLALPRALCWPGRGEVAGPGRWRWAGPGPDGRERTWSAELAGKVRFQSLAWMATDGELVEEGELQFRPVEGRTEVTCRLRYRGAEEGGPFGPDAVKDHVDRALARFKALVEPPPGAAPG